jgi:hypothetical protein
MREKLMGFQNFTSVCTFKWVFLPVTQKIRSFADFNFFLANAREDDSILHSLNEGPFLFKGTVAPG